MKHLVQNLKYFSKASVRQRKIAIILPPPTVITCTDSTNRVLAQAWEDQVLAEYTSVIALHQTSGRGRLGHQWTAPASTALLSSTIVNPTRLNPLWVNLAAGLAVKELVEESVSTGVQVDLKWPNDVLIDGRKVAGILSEYLGTPANNTSGINQNWTVIGVGINLYQPQEYLGPFNATSLKANGWKTSIDKELVPTQTLIKLANRLNQLLEQRLAMDSILDTYRQQCSTIGQEVTAVLPNNTIIKGLATGIDSDGSLLIENHNIQNHNIENHNTKTHRREVVTVSAAEVSLKGSSPKQRELIPTTCKECQ